MYKEITLIALLAAGASAQSAPSAKAAPAPAQSQPASAELPKSATANADGSWSWTDKDGKRWTYWKTQFGYSRTPAADTAHATNPKGIPADAVPAGDGTYIWTDKDGKKWSYSTNLFGVTRVPYTGSKDAKVKVTDKGDSVRFERAGMFGPEVWEKKKSDLSADERKLYESQKAKAQ